MTIVSKTMSWMIKVLKNQNQTKMNPMSHSSLYLMTITMMIMINNCRIYSLIHNKVNKNLKTYNK